MIFLISEFSSLSITSTWFIRENVFQSILDIEIFSSLCIFFSFSLEINYVEIKGNVPGFWRVDSFILDTAIRGE